MAPHKNATAQSALTDSLALAQAHSDLNAFITLATPTDVNAPQGRLFGYAVAVKDNIHVAGLPNTVGTRTLKDFVPKDDAAVIARLKSAGVVIMGKTNMHELAFGITSNNSVFGPVRNPYDKTRFAGGSSGGSAAAVAMRIVPVALGTDTGGSVRLPAALCGVIGFRPSLGRYPMAGITPVAHTRDTPGPIALTMETITLFDSVMAAKPQVTQAADLSAIRLGVVRDTFYQNLNSETAKVMAQALKQLEVKGVTLVELEMPEIAELNANVSFPVALYECRIELEKYLQDYAVGKNFADLVNGSESPDVNGIFASMADANGAIPKEVYELAISEHRVTMKNVFANCFRANKIDALVLPTTILPAGSIAGTVMNIEHNGEALPTFATYIQNTDPGSNTGLPGISLPIGLTKEAGLPVGMALDGPEGSDEALLSIAISLEAVLNKIAPPANAG